MDTVSASNNKIITTSRRANFNLFWLEEDGWIESVVDFVFESKRVNFQSVQLVTVRKIETKR